MKNIEKKYAFSQIDASRNSQQNHKIRASKSTCTATGSKKQYGNHKVTFKPNRICWSDQFPETKTSFYHSTLQPTEPVL